MSTTQTGNEAEAATAQYLEAQGYEIIARNWKRPYAEIDIVAKKSKTIYFVEVKYRQSNLVGDGFDYITTQKLHHMQRAAEAWVQENDWNGPNELLAAAVAGEGKNYQIEIRSIA